MSRAPCRAGSRHASAAPRRAFSSWAPTWAAASLPLRWRRLQLFCRGARCFLSLEVSGCVWAIAWYRWFRNEPGEHASVSEAEREWIETQRMIPERNGKTSIAGAALRSPSIWFLCLMYFTQTYGFTLYVTWLPTYLEREKLVHGLTLSILSGLPSIVERRGRPFGRHHYRHIDAPVWLANRPMRYRRILACAGRVVSDGWDVFRRELGRAC